MSTITVTRRRACAVLAAVAACGGTRARADDDLRIIIDVERSEIISSDRKRVRLAEPAEFVFGKTNPEQFKLLYPTDDSQARTLLPLIILSAARRTFGSLTAEQILRDEGRVELIELINRDAKSLFVAVREHKMRYVPVPPP